MLDPRDVSPLEAKKAFEAADRFRLEVIRESRSASFEAAYAMLDGFFGPLGELEPAETLGRFVDEPRLDYAPGVEGHYRLIAAWDGDELAGVRDCYIDVDRNERRSLVAFSHSFVAPAYRRGGLAALFRALPASLAREIVQRELGGPAPTLLGTEMEPVAPEKRESIVRLVAYGRAGFKVIDPRRLPYSQPDFRDIEALGLAHTAIPLLAVVRVLDEPEATSISVEMAASFPRLFHVCHRMYLPAWRVDPSEEHALGALRRESGPVPLLPLPTSPDDLRSLRPLLKAEVLSLYPPGIRGPAEAPRDAEADWAKVQ